MRGALPRPAQCIKERLRTFMGSFRSTSSGADWLIAGLGNPEPKYDATRHNAGFEALDYLAAQWQCPLNKSKWQGLYGTAQVGEHKVVLLKPLTYMNLSGLCVKELKQKFKDARILVIADNIDLPKGNIRYKERGSGGTHNGLRNIVKEIGEDFERIRVGIGRDIFMDLADYVLSKYDKEYFAPIIEKVADEVLNRLK